MLLLLLPLLTACTDKTSTDTEGSVVGDITLTLTQNTNIPTVLGASWDTSLEGITSAVVEFGPDTSYGHEVDVDLGAGSPYSALLVGSKPEATVHARVVAQTADGEVVSEDVTTTTGPAPTSLPNLTVETTGADHWEGYLVTGVVASTTAVLIDSDGEYVWWYTGEHPGAGGPGEGGGGGGILLGRSALSRDATKMYYTFNNVQGEEQNYIYQVSLDGTALDPISTPYLHHDFVELPDGTFAYPSYDPRDVDGERVMGDRILELDPDGNTREVWNIWDTDYDPSLSLTPGETWPHLNAIDYLEDEDAYQVGFLALGAILRIDRATGVTTWTLGGTKSDYALEDGSTDLFDCQHQFDWQPDTQSMVVFVNGAMEAGSVSRAIEYQLGDDGVATEIWSYWPDPGLSSRNLGDVDRLESGNTLVTFSLSGVIHEVDPAGVPVWSLTAEIGGAWSYVRRVDL